jgi:hypothetical protein
VAGAPYIGGIAHTNSGSIADDVFWDRQTSGVAVGVLHGTQIPDANGLTTAQMSVASSFGPNWNFATNGVWGIPARATHPVLRWQLER